MSETNEESKQVGIPDEALPADLVPGDDNPLAEGLPAGETVEGLLDEDETEGKDEEDTAYAPAEGTGVEGERADPPPPEESTEAQET
jgi:hypothetical protein